MDIMLFLKKLARIWAGHMGRAPKPSKDFSKLNTLSIKSNSSKLLAGRFFEFGMGDGEGGNVLIQNGLHQRRISREMETKVLGIRIPLFLD
jgi:hypothetical protein